MLEELQEYDLLVELGILQNVVEIESMNYGWTKTAGNLRSRERYVGDTYSSGLVYSEKDFSHIKFSVKRSGLDIPLKREFPWGLVFGVDELEDGYDLWMVLSEGRDPEVLRAGEEEVSSSGGHELTEGDPPVTVQTLEAEEIDKQSAKLKGSVDLEETEEAEVYFRYSKYDEQEWWISADAHVGYGGDFSAADLEKAVKDTINLDRTEFAIHLGDLVENRKEAVPPFQRKMDMLDHGWTYALGNHDVDGWWWDEEDEAPLVKPPEYGHKIINGVRFIWLSDEGDGNWDHDGGYGRQMFISDEQNEWFKSLMDEDPEIPTVLLTHQGPCIDGDWAEDIPDFWDEEERGWLKQNIDDYNLIAWVHGHRHTWIIDEDFQGYGFDRLSIDSIDKDTETNRGLFMNIKRNGNSTELKFTFRDHAEEEWMGIWGEKEHVIELEDSYIEGWQVTDPITVTESGSFEQEVTELDPATKYRFEAVVDVDGEVNSGEEEAFKTYLYDLMIGKVHYDDEQDAWEVMETYGETLMGEMAWGLILEREGNKIKAFATEEEDETPTECVLDHAFEDIPWEETVMGIWGMEAEIHTVLGFARYEYANLGEYQDYSIRWTEDGSLEGDIKMNRDQKLIEHLQGGAHAFIYSKPYGREVERNDLYGKRSLLFSGYVTDFEDTDNVLNLELESVMKDLDEYRENVLIDDISFAGDGLEIEVRNCFDILEDIFDNASRLKSFEHVERSEAWHEKNDRVFSVRGNLLEATNNFAYFLDIILRSKFVEEGTFVDAAADKPASGEQLVVKSEELAEDRDENLIVDLDLNKSSGSGEYINKLRGMGYLPQEDMEWSPVRTNRLKRLLGEEMIITEDDVLRLAQFVGSREDISDTVEDFLDEHEYDWTGTLLLHDHHHYLGGHEKQGTVKIEHSGKDLFGEFRVAGFEIFPYGTQLFLTQKPRSLREPAETDFEKEFEWMENKNVIEVLGTTRFEVWEDSVTAFDTGTITEAKLVGEVDMDITSWVPVHESSYKGYKFVDAKFSEQDFIGDSKDWNPDKIVLKNAAGGTYAYELENFYKYGSWCLEPDPYGSGDTIYESSIFATVGLMEDHYEFDIMDGYLVLGEPSGDLGTPAAGGGKIGDPRGKDRLIPPWEDET